MKICCGFVLFSLLHTCLGYADLDPQLNTKNVRKRINIMARELLTENHHRVNRMRAFRWMYEESPHYEVGYVFGEIIERYRKMVEIVRKTHGYEDIFFHTLYNLENSQSLYLEIYHLVCMLHEIPRKWGDEPEFADIRFYHDTKTKPESGTISPEEQFIRWSRLFDIYKERKRQRQQQMKLWRKHRQLEAIYKQYQGNIKNRQPKNNRWPLDYGWEVEDYDNPHG